MKPGRPYHGYTAYHREPGGLRRLDFFVRKLEAWRGSRKASDLRVLDIGCGNGNIGLPIASLGYQVTGVDGDEASIVQAKAKAEDLGLKQVDFRVGWVEALAGEQFDVIVASEVLEHQKDPDTFLQSLKGMLEPDGLLLLSVPNGQSFEESIRKFTTHTAIGRAFKRMVKRRVLGHESVQSQAMHPHEQFFSWAALARTLDRNGWSVEDVSQAAAIFKEFFYLGGRLCIKRGSPLFHRWDESDAKLAEKLPIPRADGWLIESRAFDVSKPLIMHILPTLAGGGAERVVHDICARVPELGFRVQAVAVLRGGPLEPAFRASHIPVTILGKRGFLGLSAVYTLMRLMRWRRPSVVHTHLFGADVWGRLAAMWAGVRVRIVTEHNVPFGQGILKQGVKTFLLPFTTRFIAVSEEVKRAMVADEGVPPKRIQVIRNGIDMSRVIPRQKGNFGSQIRLLIAGRLVEQKGVDVLLRALATIGTPWFLQIAGSGDDEQQLKALAERLGLSPRVRWLGQRDDVPTLLAASDVFCFPSRWEGLGLSLVEAAAAGVPIVASDLTVFGEVLDADDAEFASPGDPQALAQALTRLFADPAKALARAERIRPRILEAYSADTMAKAHADLYRSLL